MNETYLCTIQPSCAIFFCSIITSLYLIISEEWTIKGRSTRGNG